MTPGAITFLDVGDQLEHAVGLELRHVPMLKSHACSARDVHSPPRRGA
jgi:hypothetical protein